MRRRFLFLACLLGLAAFAGVCYAEDQPDKILLFMKEKLEHSKKVLEGLTKEDFDLIVKHAEQMSLLTEDEMWQVLQTPEYLDRSKEFLRSVERLKEAGRKKNLEGAALAYVDITMKCVSCHSYVRKTRMADTGNWRRWLVKGPSHAAGPSLTAPLLLGPRANR